MGNSKLTKIIYDKNFEIKDCGYGCEQVDAFLDEICVEISHLEKDLEGLKLDIQNKDMQINMLEKKNKELSYNLTESKIHNQISNNTSGSFSNIDLLNRITNLENMVSELLRKIK